MGQRRKTGDQSRLPAISRRAVVGAAASATAAPLAGAFCAPGPEDLVRRCAEWVAVDREIDRLALDWSNLEIQAVAQFDWFKLSRAERQRVPMAAQMEAIDARLDGLFEVRKAGLRALRPIKPTTLHELASKLVVAAKISQHEGGALHGFIAEAVQTLAHLTCPGCGGRYVPSDWPRG